MLKSWLLPLIQYYDFSTRFEKEYLGSWKPDRGISRRKICKTVDHYLKPELWIITKSASLKLFTFKSTFLKYVDHSNNLHWDFEAKLDLSLTQVCVFFTFWLIFGFLIYFSSDSYPHLLSKWSANYVCRFKNFLMSGNCFNTRHTLTILKCIYQSGKLVFCK